MAKLTGKDLLAKMQDCKNRKKKKRVLIHSDFLGGELEAETLSREDMADVRAKMQEDPELGAYLFIYLSIPDLRDPEVLKAYQCKRGPEIVDRLFNEVEKSTIIEILGELNGLSTTDEVGIYKVEIEEQKN